MNLVVYTCICMKSPFEIQVVKFYFIFDHFKIWKNVNKIGQYPGKHQIFITINCTEITQSQLCPIYGMPTTVGIFFSIQNNSVIMPCWSDNECLCFLLASVISPFRLSGGFNLLHSNHKALYTRWIILWPAWTWYTPEPLKQFNTDVIL